MGAVKKVVNNVGHSVKKVLGKAVSTVTGISTDTSTPTVENVATNPTPTTISDTSGETGDIDSAKKQRRKRGIASTRTGAGQSTLLGSAASDTGGRTTLG